MGFKDIFYNKNIIIGGGIFGIIVLCAVFGPVFVGNNPNAIDVSQMLVSPNINHWFGTDSYGRDIFSRMLYGARLSLFIAFCVAFISGIVGSLFGMLAGYYKKLEITIMCVMDGLMALPSLLLAMAIVAALGTGIA